MDLEKQPEIVNLHTQVKAYLLINPPTLGHGYNHLCKVAQNAYRLAIDNDANEKVAYIAGLLHDIYRPAKGEGGREVHEDVCAEIAPSILESSGLTNVIDEVVAVIRNHDEDIISGVGTVLQQILSVADKSELSLDRIMAYGWASNQHLTAEGKIPKYSNFQKLIEDFDAYRAKANAVFSRIAIKGLEEAVRAYDKAYNDLHKFAEYEKKGRAEWNTIMNLAVQREVNKEKALLQDGIVSGNTV
ncbi:HD domain-containing protein [Tolypothrix campylonemoides VB511288]|nr:HD domain-containing protein [Tolypothrix campylonemoides VB511288]